MVVSKAAQRSLNGSPAVLSDENRTGRRAEICAESTDCNGFEPPDEPRRVNTDRGSFSRG
jgi:hypothetical protein